MTKKIYFDTGLIILHCRLKCPEYGRDRHGFMQEILYTAHQQRIYIFICMKEKA
jgi:hypothetical protein